MADEAYTFRLSACRELMDSHPESLRIRRQVEALERALPGDPGVAVSFCRAIIETTCKTILRERGTAFQDAWEAPRLITETKKCLGLEDRKKAEKKDELLRKNLGLITGGVTNVVTGISNIRNDHGAAAHGAEAYEPLLDAGYAEILARSTDAIVGFLFRTHKGEIIEPKPLISYGENTEFDDRIDGEFGPFVILNSEMAASEVLFRVDYNAYVLELENFIEQQEAATAEPAETEPREADA